MTISFVILKLEEEGQIDPPQGVTGSRYSQGEIGLRSYNPKENGTDII